MQSIHKYPVPIVDDVEIELPVGAQVLTVQVQMDKPFIWALVSKDTVRTEMRQFRLIGTGHPIEDDAKRYVGTFQLHGGDLVFHLFEKIEEP